MELRFSPYRDLKKVGIPVSQDNQFLDYLLFNVEQLDDVKIEQIEKYFDNVVGHLKRNSVGKRK